MKKNLFAAVVFLFFLNISKAQNRGVGINHSSPAATLDIAPSISDLTMPDALIIPRMTAAELIAKDNTSGTYGPLQNGALVFITSGPGTTARTMKITQPGFYYFDITVPEWKSLSGGSSTMGVRLKLDQGASELYDWSDSNYDYWEFTSGNPLTLPNPSSYSGRTIYIRNQSGGTLQFSGTDGIGTPKGLTSMSQGAIQIYSNGTAWYLTTGRN